MARTRKRRDNTTADDVEVGDLIEPGNNGARATVIGKETNPSPNIIEPHIMLRWAYPDDFSVNANVRGTTSGRYFRPDEPITRWLDPAQPDRALVSAPGQQMRRSSMTKPPTSQEVRKTATETVHSGEISGLNAAIGYADNLGKYCATAHEGIAAATPDPDALAHACQQSAAILQADGVRGDTLEAVHAVQSSVVAAAQAVKDAMAGWEAAAAAAQKLHTGLSAQTTVQDAYAASPDAGSREFLTSEAATAAESVTSHMPSSSSGSHTMDDAPQPASTPQDERPRAAELEEGPYAVHKLPDPTEDAEMQQLVAEYFDPMQDKDPAVLKAVLDSSPDATTRDAWTRRADEIARAWGASLHGPGGLLEYTQPAGTIADQCMTDDPAAAEAPIPAPDPVVEPDIESSAEVGTVPAEPAPAVELAAPAPAAAAPVSGQLLDQPLIENDWGAYTPGAPVSFHDEGVIGDAVNYMGADARMNVDGEPLGDVIGKIATEVVRGDRTTQQAIDALAELRDRVPEGSKARMRLSIAVSRMDAPMTPLPDIPDGTPEPLIQLVKQLHAVPMARREPEKELQPVLDIIRDIASGDSKPRYATRDLEQLRNRRHESFGDQGKFEIDRAIIAAAEALRQPQPAPAKPTETSGATVMATSDVTAIVAKLRTTDTEADGSTYLDEQKLTREKLLAVAAALQVTRVQRLSMKELKKRILRQAIGARRKYEGLRSW